MPTTLGCFARSTNRSYVDGRLVGGFVGMDADRAAHLRMCRCQPQHPVEFGHPVQIVTRCPTPFSTARAPAFSNFSGGNPKSRWQILSTRFNVGSLNRLLDETRKETPSGFGKSAGLGAGRAEG